MTFSSLKMDDRLLRATQALGYTEMTPVQEQAIPQLLAGRDIVGTAQTGTGKTAAFVLPILQHLLTRPAKSRQTRALIVTPTRELAEQVNAAIRQLARYTKIRSATVYGGVGFEPQTRALRHGTEIIVACPGRLLDHIGRGNADLRAVEALVLDEGDRMLDMGFLPPIREIVRQVPKQRHTMLFSATFAPELDGLAREILHDPYRVEIGLAAPATTVEHALYPVENERKTPLLLHLLEAARVKSAIVFTRTKHRADRVARQIAGSGYKAAVLHSNKSQSQRQSALDGFRAGRYQLLIATDIAARGLDIEMVSHVINYDVPNTADDYIHRIGRTGRAEHNGDALTLVTPEDRDTLRAIERTLGEPIEVREVDGLTCPACTIAPLPPPTMRPKNFSRFTGSRTSRARGYRR
jgi:ATP-dependent RNA helicase RhlE